MMTVRPKLRISVRVGEGQRNYSAFMGDLRFETYKPLTLDILG